MNRFFRLYADLASAYIRVTGHSGLFFLSFFRCKTRATRHPFRNHILGSYVRSPSSSSSNRLWKDSAIMASVSYQIANLLEKVMKGIGNVLIATSKKCPVRKILFYHSIFFLWHNLEFIPYPTKEWLVVNLYRNKENRETLYHSQNQSYFTFDRMLNMYVFLKQNFRKKLIDPLKFKMVHDY